MASKAEGHYDKMSYDMEECMKQKCITGLIIEEKFARIDIHQFLLNAHGDQIVNV